MYEGLVKTLKESTPNRRLMFTAADAIEELSKLADAIPHVCECCIGCELEKKNGGCDHGFVLSPKRAMQYLIKPRWIPVAERLPEFEQKVLTLGKNGGQEVGTFRGLCHRSDAWEWKKNIARTVTHWMALPEPPKDGES